MVKSQQAISMKSTLKTLCLARTTWLATSLLVCASMALGRIHLRVQTTLVGYDIGHLKGEEGKLLEERALLKMQLAKLTTKKHLLMMSETGSDNSLEAETMAAK